MYFTGFDCLGCHASYPPDQDLLLCPACHELLEARYDLARFGREVDRDALARRPSDVWRWTELLPVLDPTRIVTLGEGGTPFLRSERLARACGVRELWLKSDAANPTGSLKDRSITVSATKAVEFGYGVLACDSTGNKASSTAAYAARAGLQSVVFCPKDTPRPKMAQAVFFGARLIRVDGHYSQINAMYRRLIASGRVKWYDCGTDNPFRYEGKKTYAYEIAQDLGWRVPDRVLHPAAGGMSLVKTWKGFNELRTLGWVDRLPKYDGGAGRPLRAHRPSRGRRACRGWPRSRSRPPRRARSPPPIPACSATGPFTRSGPPAAPGSRWTRRRSWTRSACSVRTVS